MSVTTPHEHRTAEDAQTELQFIGGVFAGLAVLAYFAGFLVRYYFLDELGLSPSSSTLPLYYFGVYGYSVIAHAPWTIGVMLGAGALTALLCESVRRRLPENKARSHTVYAAYPALGVAFLAALFVLPPAAQDTARSQFRALWEPRHAQGVRLSLRPPLQLRCGRAKPAEKRDDRERLACANDDGRLVLVAESPRDLIYFERRSAVQGALPVTSIYRLRRDDVLVTTTRTGP